MKTSTIRLYSIKTECWGELAHELGLSPEKQEKYFEYGEFANVEIEVDENMNIIGGHIRPRTERF